MRTPSIPRNWLILLGLTYLLFLFYMIVVIQLVYTAVVVSLLVTLVGYLGWRLWRIFRMHEQRLETETAAVEQTKDETEADDDPVDSLKQQYTAGELSEAEFEEQLDELLKGDNEFEPRENVTARSELETVDRKTAFSDEESE